MQITNFTIHRLHLPLPRPIGDSQVRYTDHWIMALELHTDLHLTGVGFELQQGTPLPPSEYLSATFEQTRWEQLKARPPWEHLLQLGRPRGGNVGVGAFSLAVETALWDLVAQRENVPLYRLLGGTSPTVAAYGSTLDFPLSDADFRKRLQEFKEQGFQAVKIKVGHPELAWDLARLQIVHDVFGRDVRIMVDANEAWSPKEALIRIRSYFAAGFPIYWVEDPIDRQDFVGLNRLCSELPETRINTGEYLGYTGKRQLLEQHAVDVLNVHGSVVTSRAIATLAGDYGIPLALGNTLLEIGVHLAASFPECLCLEFSDLIWNELAVTPVTFAEGMATAPERPGHGIVLNPAAVAKYAESGSTE